MKKLIAIPLSIIAVATLGACASRPADTFPRASIAPQPVAYIAGTGTITQVAASPSYYGNDAGRTAPATSSAGGSAGANIGIARASSAYNRLSIRMDDGKTMQYVDTDSTEFRPGMRVQLLPDHTIKPL
jgi:outer membrane lipoprotein SlyB